MSVAKSPCYRCKDRHEKCHANCEKYAEYQASLQAEKESKKIEAGFLDYYRRKSFVLNKRKGK